MEKVACGAFSDISFVSAGYAPRAKGAAFAGCAEVRLPRHRPPEVDLRALRQISYHKLLIPLPGAG
jgi:hypothetical protein